MEHHYPPPAQRRMITISTMAAAIMNQIDTTIANVALPHMQGSTSASREEITWVLTSYIVSAAMFTPLSGWLAGRIGRKRLMMVSIVGFTFVSGLCGLAQNLTELVACRMLQGIFGSALVPMSQATLLDINPPGEHGKAMAVFGLAAIVGPLAGPLLGGWLTDNLSWRWVFYINLPIGMLSLLGISAFMEETPTSSARRFDLFGFAALIAAIGALQLVLDRGQLLDWFDSPEICVEAALAVAAIWVFVIHSATARHPFVSTAIFRDFNFVMSTGLGFALGVLIYSSSSIVPTMMETLMGYPVLSVGMALAPRGIGTLTAMLVMGRVINRVDPRLLVFCGLIFSALSMYQLAQMSLLSDDRLVVISGIVSGVASSSVFVPLSAMGFATLPAHLRNEGSAMSSLIRNLGASAGIAVVQALAIRNAAVVHARLVEGLRPDSPTLGFALGGFDWNSLASLGGLDAEIGRQATMVADIDTFWALCVFGMVAAPLVILMRVPRRG